MSARTHRRRTHSCWNVEPEIHTELFLDGNGPLTTTFTKHWPRTRIQRCLFHSRQDIHCP